MQNNQLPTESHAELEDNSVMIHCRFFVHGHQLQMMLDIHNAYLEGRQKWCLSFHKGMRSHLWC
jgi:hypothetical protein